MPVTHAGKIDKNKLPEPEETTFDDYAAPRNQIEEKITEIWAGVLNRERESIGVETGFFQLGGHSLKASAVASLIHKTFNVKITIGEIFENPTIESLSRCIARKSADRYFSIEPVEEKDYYPLSSAQKRLYILQQMDEGSTFYNMQEALRLEPPVEQGRLEWIFRELIGRHESLRTSFSVIGGEPVQRVHDPGAVALCFENLELPEAIWDTWKKEAAGSGGRNQGDAWCRITDTGMIKEILKNFIKPFELWRAPLLRLGLAVSAEVGGLLLVDLHHIIMDGTSREILVKDFAALYSGRRLEPAQLPVRYKDYARWQQSGRHRESIKSQETYWVNAFAGELPVLQLPVDYPRPLVQRFEGKTVCFVLGKAVTRALKKTARELDATLFMVLLGVYTVMLSKLSNREDIVVGVPVAARRQSELRHIVGMFVNTLPMRNYPDAGKTVGEFLAELKQRTLEAFENQEYQFEDLVERISARRDTSRNPVFDVMFNLLNQAENHDDITYMEPGRIYSSRYGNDTAKFDLNLTAVDYRETLYFELEYSTHLFKDKTIERIIEYFMRTADIISREISRFIGDIELMNETERENILRLSRGEDESFELPETIHRWFENRVEKNGDAAAVIGPLTAGTPGMSDNTGLPRSNRGVLSYRELNRRANILAWRLRGGGVGPDSLVGLMAQRSVEMIVGLLGILKAGGAYLPIDIDYPSERKRYILEDSGIRLLVTNIDVNGQKNNETFIPPGVEVIDLRKEHGGGNEAKPPCVNRDANLLYAIYTSGSTGTPKAVQLEHRNLLNLMRYQFEHTGIDSESILQFTTISFDVSFQEIFSALLSGGRLILVDTETRSDAPALFGLIEDEKIRTLFFPTSFLRLIFGNERYAGMFPGRVAHIVVAGEQLIVGNHLKEYLKRNNVYLHNHYGPSETHVVTALTIDPRQEIPTRPTIGKPVSNSGIYIVDKGMHLQPPGVPGELCISGIQVGRGYLTKKELTAQRFVENPFKPAERMYRTGDQARWLPDGNIEFLGRMDHQVKIRGYRIEPGEIESKLSERDDIKEAVVTVGEDDKGNKYLCAYIVFAAGISSTADRNLPESTARLKRYLAQKLPPYMIPAYYVRLDKIPLTPNGKVDKTKLPAPETGGGEPGNEPLTPVQAALKEIWADVLYADESPGESARDRIDTISVGDDFFQSGGHSLKATVMSALVHKRFNVKIPLAKIFLNPTIAGLSEYIEAASGDTYKPIQPGETKEYYPVSSAQKRMFLLNQLKGNSTSDNIPGALYIQGNLDKRRFENVIKALIDRHETLRTSFRLIDEIPVQRVHDNVDFQIAYGSTTENEVENQIESFVRPFDLKEAPLIRIALMKIAGRKSVLIFDMHHIISDGVSIGILTRDFIGLYGQQELPELKIQYRDFSLWQNRRGEEDAQKCRESFWLDVFSGELPVLNLPTDFPRPGVQRYEGDYIEFEFEDPLTDSLNEIAAANGATLFMVILAIYNVLLAKFCGQEDIIVGTPTAGRLHAGQENIIGFFINTLALRNYPAADKTFLQFLDEVKENALGAYENQDYQFDDLVQKLYKRREPGRHPLFDTMINTHLEEEEFPGEVGELTFKAIKFQKKVTQTDFMIHVAERERLYFRWIYCTALFKRETVQLLIKGFEDIARIVIEDNNIVLKDINISTNLVSTRSNILKEQIGEDDFGF
jgi:iturin family lipopeptide synthetase B